MNWKWFVLTFLAVVTLNACATVPTGPSVTSLNSSSVKAKGLGVAITHSSKEDKSLERKGTDFTLERYIANRSFFCRARGALSFLKP
jgi:hypothetical protein